MRARRVTGDLFLNHRADVFAIEEHVIWFNVCIPRLLSVNADMTKMEKRTAVNDAARTVQEIQSKKRLCGNLLD
jgi:hypothetical protein